MPDERTATQRSPNGAVAAGDKSAQPIRDRKRTILPTHSHAPHPPPPPLRSLRTARSSHPRQQPRPAPSYTRRLTHPPLATPPPPPSLLSLLPPSTSSLPPLSPLPYPLPLSPLFPPPSSPPLPLPPPPPSLLSSPFPPPPPSLPLPSPPPLPLPPPPPPLLPPPLPPPPPPPTHTPHTPTLLCSLAVKCQLRIARRLRAWLPTDGKAGIAAGRHPSANRCEDVVLDRSLVGSISMCSASSAF